LGGCPQGGVVLVPMCKKRENETARWGKSETRQAINVLLKSWESAGQGTRETECEKKSVLVRSEKQKTTVEFICGGKRGKSQEDLLDFWGGEALGGQKKKDQNGGKMTNDRSIKTRRR